MASTDWDLAPGLVFLGTDGEPGDDGPFLLLCTRCRSHLRRHEHQLSDPHGPCRLREEVLMERVQRLVGRAIEHASTGRAGSAHRAWTLAARAFGKLAAVGCVRKATM